MKFGSDNKKQVEKYLENIHTLKLADIQENTKWTKKFLDRFIIEQKEYKKFIDNISIENWNNLLNKIKYKPLVKIENKYYILLEQKFYDNFDKIAIQGICENSNLKSQEIRAKYTLI